MDWLAFSLSNQQPCFFEPFAAAAPRHDRAEDEAQPPPATPTADCPKLEDFLGGRFAGEGPAERGAYESELKSIAAGFLRGPTPEQEELSKAVVVAEDEDEPRKAVDTFGQRTSIYRGVTRHRWTGRYEAHLWDNSCRREGQTRKGRQVYLGGYDKEEKAARAYDLAALKYWGPTTTTNFPVSIYEKELEEMKTMNRQEFVASLRRKSSGFSRGASIYRGVTRHHQHGRWQARIGRVAGNKDLYLGTFSTQEEAAEAYDIAAIKFRGPNAVTNFDISRYDVKSIMSSNLPIGGMSGRSSSKSSDSPPPSEAKTLALPPPASADLPASSLNFMAPYHSQQQEQSRQHDYWSLVALHQQGHQNQYFNLFPPAIGVGGYAASGSIAPTILPEHGGYDWGSSEQSQSQSSSSEIPYATPIAVYDGTGSGNWVSASANVAPVHPYHQPATIFGIE